MSGQQVLYEAKLAKVGGKGTPVSLIILVFWVGLGYVLCFHVTAVSDRVLPLCLFVLGTVALGFGCRRMIRLRRNPGHYRISVDDGGLYVQCDDAHSTGSFSVKAPDLCCLVRKAIPDSDGNDTYEYYVETKSGTRHEIDPFFAEYDPVHEEGKPVNAMKIFLRIRERFPWVAVRQESWRGAVRSTSGLSQ